MAEAIIRMQSDKGDSYGLFDQEVGSNCEVGRGVQVRKSKRDINHHQQRQSLHSPQEFERTQGLHAVFEHGIVASLLSLNPFLFQGHLQRCLNEGNHCRMRRGYGVVQLIVETFQAIVSLRDNSSFCIVGQSNIMKVPDLKEIHK